MTAKRSWWKVALGVVLTALMLFPVYWMVNVSLTRTQDLRSNPPQIFPFDATFEGYEAVLRQQLPNLGTSLLIGLGCVLLTVVIAAPAGYAIALLNLRGGRSLNFILLVAQMIPAVVMAMGFYAIYVRAGL
ncbi:MAG: carbohydrate ABC transporter permease, partial [Microbacterium sp.]|nr:carbohydrate ABC transporter permease [Microbacterium sp.]